MEHSYIGNVCRLNLQLPNELSNESDSVTRRIENVRNCDVFVEDYNFIIYIDVQLFKFHSTRQFDTKDMKNLIIKFNTKIRRYEIDLHCLPQSDDELRQQSEKGELEKKATKHANADHNALDLWKLKRITEHCQLQLDESAELLRLESNFGYGFASRFRGKIISGECDLSAISRMPEPQLTSPLQRTIDREIDELKNFSRDQYKLNFVELQVPDGHDNPMKFVMNFKDAKLGREEQCLLHNLTRKPEELQLVDTFDQSEIDFGLVSMLLAICYDIRSTSNEPTCESAWTRSVLSATLNYFEPFENLKEVVISFLRRSLIYPLYRNYEFGRLCVQDAVDALQKHPPWLLKQMLLSHELFASSDCNRELFNRYYIEDYIRYLYAGTRCTAEHLQMLARNLKNVLLDVYKKHLRLDLGEIETELLKELITDIHIAGGAGGGDHSSASEEDDDDYEDVTDEDEQDAGSDEDETETSSESETTEENSVIEQCKEAAKI